MNHLAFKTNGIMLIISTSYNDRDINYAKFFHFLPFSAVEQCHPNRREWKNRCVANGIVNMELNNMPLLRINWFLMGSFRNVHHHIIIMEKPNRLERRHNLNFRSTGLRTAFGAAAMVWKCKKCTCFPNLHKMTRNRKGACVRAKEINVWTMPAN